MANPIREVAAFYEAGGRYGFDANQARYLLRTGIGLTERYAGKIALTIRGVRLHTSAEALDVRKINLPTESLHTRLLTKREALDEEDGNTCYGGVTDRGWVDIPTTHSRVRHVTSSRVLIAALPDHADPTGWGIIESIAHEESHALGFVAHCATGSCMMREEIAVAATPSIDLAENPFCGDCSDILLHAGIQAAKDAGREL